MAGAGNDIAGALVAVGVGAAMVAGLKLIGNLLTDLFD
jgi:hypothetical protein